jgi:hypothetical protein
MRMTSSTSLMKILSNSSSRYALAQVELGISFLHHAVPLQAAP